MILTDKTFDEYISQGDKIVICTAGYCKPCRAAIRNIQRDVGVLNLTDPQSHGAMIKTRVKRVPTVIYYHDGTELKRAVGTAAILDIDQACKS